MQRQRIAYVIADSGHGRIVMWDSRTHNFRTRMTLQSGPSARTDPSSRGELHGPPPRKGRRLGDRISLRKRMRSEFAAVLIERIRAFTREIPVEGIVLAAPARFLALLRDGLPDSPPVVGAVVKDLVKIPDHELSGWLSGAAPEGQTAG